MKKLLARIISKELILVTQQAYSQSIFHSETSDELCSFGEITLHRLQQIERRFSKNQSLSDQYHKFMNDYLKLGHMQLTPENEIDVPASSSFPLPHHPVPNKNGDKFRVIFDGSAKSSSGVFLNNKLMVSPQLQIDLTTLLLRFRMHKISTTAALKDLNVDDLMSGANSLSEALELQNQLTQMLSSAGLVLRK
ncbi:uncharacterized protein LOC103569155 [Trichonephila clavipes]|nr:uncharacterized protein LOC103569155 [Trichonephila clavipes]